jgi:hypothetical protein
MSGPDATTIQSVVTLMEKQLAVFDRIVTAIEDGNTYFRDLAREIEKADDRCPLCRSDDPTKRYVVQDPDLNIADLSVRPKECDADWHGLGIRVAG